MPTAVPIKAIVVLRKSGTHDEITREVTDSGGLGVGSTYNLDDAANGSGSIEWRIVKFLVVLEKRVESAATEGHRADHGYLETTHYRAKCERLIEEIAIDGRACGEAEQAEGYRNLIKAIEGLYDEKPKE